MPNPRSTSSSSSLLSRRRALRTQLTDSPWSLAAGFGLAIAAMTWLGRLVMLAFAVSSGLLRTLSAGHLLTIAADLGHDLIVFLGATLLIGGLLRFPRYLRWFGLLLSYLLLISASLLVIVSVPLYRTLQTTLQLSQLLLAGGVQDLAEAGLSVIPIGAFSAALLLLCALTFGVPWFAAFARRHLTLRPILACIVLAAALSSLGRFEPESGSQLLQMSAVYDFLASVERFAMRRTLHVDMKGAPHFDASLMFGKPPAAVPTESLVDVSKLPLHHPNVVLIVLESAAINYTGLWDGRPEDTPRLTEMSKYGLMFDQYYSPTPVSMKSLFELTCSSYPHTSPPAETYTNPSINCLSISELLKQENYRTALFHGGRFSYTKKDAYLRYRHYDVMRDAERLQNRAKYSKVPWGVDDRAVIDDAIQWLDQGNPANPYFLHILFLAPHEPYVVHNTPEPFGTKKDSDRYRNATLFIDGQVGRLWDWVKSHGQADNTLFVIVGDHGEAFNEHPGDTMHGGRIYDASVHTPLMFVNPLLFHGQRSDRVGNHPDLVPTILDLLGIPKPARHQGFSLLRGYQPHMIYFYADWQRHYLGLRDGQWKFIYNVDRQRYELFDLSKDRNEQNNLAFRYPAQVEAYAKRVLNWEAFYYELIPNYEHYVDGQDACKGKDECYLDELKPVLQHGILRLNRSGSGFRLQLGKEFFKRGLGVAPLSILRYNIRGDRYLRFKGAVGHHSQGGHANLSLKVSTEIYLDDQLLWSSGKLTADEPPKSFDLPIKNGALLELIGYDVDAEEWRDYIDWVNVRLTR